MYVRRQLYPVTLVEGMSAIFTDKLDMDTRRLDGLTWHDEILNGDAKETLDDEPYLIPHLVPGSKWAVIIAPGGGFCYKSMKAEGEEIAAFLNRAGISAFVLWYRLNPYKAPVPYLDLQRAVRYIRYHSDEYHIAPDRIGVMGFSAGGYVCGAYGIRLQNSQVIYNGYVEDEVDKVDDRPAFIALLYPVIQFYKSPNMLSLLVGRDNYDPEKRLGLMAEYDLVQHIHENDPPQFLCYGTKDSLHGMDAYGRRLMQLGVPNKVLVLDGAGHGYGACTRPSTKRYAYWKQEFIDWVCALEA